MFPEFCKSCQYCLESLYWKCCEERFCFDDRIATYNLETTSTGRNYQHSNANINGIVNMGASLDSVVRTQPINNNHLPQELIVVRQLNEMPLHADKIIEVFSKSFIFRDEPEEEKEIERERRLEKNKQTEGESISIDDSLEETETKSEPNLSPDKPNRTKVYFEDEVDSPVTDFEIMFKDELQAGYDIFKIEEEEESDRNSQSTEDGLTMNVAVKKQDVVKPSTVTIKDETKITTQNPIYKYEHNSAMVLPSTLSLPRVENVKGILRQRGDLSRSSSAKTLERVDSNSRLSKPVLNRVESLRSIDPNKINQVLSRVPHRSASFLNIPQHLMPEKPPLVKSKSAIGVSLLSDSENKLSSLPDTPIIKSGNLPRFFEDKPPIPKYRGESSLQSIKNEADRMVKENDFSMPRYYGTVSLSAEHVPVHESKSMPDLRNPSSSNVVSKRLVKLRSKLKPLVIKKGTDEKL